MANSGQQSWIAARIEEVLNDAAYDVHAAETQLREVQNENLRLKSEVNRLRESIDSLGVAHLKVVASYETRLRELKNELEAEKKAHKVVCESYELRLALLGDNDC